MKLLRVILAAVLVASCGDAQEDVDLLKGALFPNAPRFNPRAEELGSRRPIPPRLEVAFPSRDLSGVMLLEVTRDGVQTWLSADGATITLQQGFLTSTKGFGSGMAGSDISEIAALVLNGREGHAKRYHSFLNGNDQIELHAYHCQIENQGSETVFLLGVPTATTRLQEHCSGVTDHFKNTYWLKLKEKTIVKSSQWTGTFLGNLAMKAVPDDI